MIMDHNCNDISAMPDCEKHNSKILEQLIKEANISSLKELSQIAGVAEIQLWRIQYGLLPKITLETIIKIANALNVPLNKFLSLFLATSLEPELTTVEPQPTTHEHSQLKLEYQLLQQQIKQQQTQLQQEFKESTIQSLESWLLQWATAKTAIQQNPQILAVKIVPLMKPVEQLLEKWGLSPIASVDQHIPYDPQWHQLINGSSQTGDLVKVRYVGYRLGDKLLYRAKVIAL